MHYIYYTLEFYSYKGKFEGETPFYSEETSEEKPSWFCILYSEIQVRSLEQAGGITHCSELLNFHHQCPLVAIKIAFPLMQNCEIPKMLI